MIDWFKSTGKGTVHEFVKEINSPRSKCREDESTSQTGGNSAQIYAPTQHSLISMMERVRPHWGLDFGHFSYCADKDKLNENWFSTTAALIIPSRRAYAQR